MNDADWLEPWRNEVIVHADGKPILELGCGRGFDSQRLASYGPAVVAVDINSEALAYCCAIDGCFPIQADISKPLPFQDDAFGFVLASLSLHYFSWQDTLSIVHEIRRILSRSGILLLRVNSTEDINFGAGAGEELEKNYYLNDSGQKKRFFERSDVELMLAGMNVVELWHETIDRYGKDKKVWVAHASGD